MTMEKLQAIREVAATYGLSANYLPQRRGYQLAIMTPGNPYGECVFTSWALPGRRWEYRGQTGREIGAKVRAILES